MGGAWAGPADDLPRAGGGPSQHCIIRHLASVCKDWASPSACLHRSAAANGHSHSLSFCHDRGLGPFLSPTANGYIYISVHVRPWRQHSDQAILGHCFMRDGVWKTCSAPRCIHPAPLSADRCSLSSATRCSKWGNTAAAAAAPGRCGLCASASPPRCFSPALPLVARVVFPSLCDCWHDSHGQAIKTARTNGAHASTQAVQLQAFLGSQLGNASSGIICAQLAGDAQTRIEHACRRETYLFPSLDA